MEIEMNITEEKTVVLLEQYFKIRKELNKRLKVKQDEVCNIFR